MDIRSTLNLPSTSFSMKANLSQKEPQLLNFWDEKEIYLKMKAHRAGGEKFIFHDGPPYANGKIHIGHALNKILKDIVIKFKTLTGYEVNFVPGWDTHGLPIELAVISNLNKDRSEVSVQEIRKKCRNYALKHVEMQKKDFIRLGCFANWNEPT
jgi:isoleucyl-tRNA synthetase